MRSPSLSACLCAFVLATCAFATACARPVTSTTCTGVDVLLQSPGGLTAAVDMTYPPFALIDPKSGDATGFEVDLLTAVAAKIKLRPHFVNRTSSVLVPGLIAHRHDVAASALRSTDELVAQTCRSTSYLTGDLGLLVQTSNPRGIHSASDLGGKTVGVIRSSAADRWATNALGSASPIVRLTTPEDLHSELRSGKIDVAVDDLPVARRTETTTPDLHVVQTISLPGGYVFALAPDNAALTKEFDRAIGQLEGDGTLIALEKKWFGPSI